MTITNPLGNPLGSLRTRSLNAPAIGPQVVLTGALTAILVVTAAFRPILPDDAILPGVSALFMTAGAIAALIAWNRPLPPRQFSYWDAAGVLTLLGICVAAAVEPEQMVRLVAGADRSP